MPPCTCLNGAWTAWSSPQWVSARCITLVLTHRELWVFDTNSSVWYQWLGTRLWYLQCICNEDTVVLHKVIDMGTDSMSRSHFVEFMQDEWKFCNTLNLHHSAVTHGYYMYGNFLEMEWWYQIIFPIQWEFPFRQYEILVLKCPTRAWFSIKVKCNQDGNIHSGASLGAWIINYIRINLWYLVIHACPDFHGSLGNHH